ncbi:Histidinol-phosphate aminotransferase [Mycena sanguinolenta]|uniref:histidinol-phosphate transaminase n=1 Tax=Mycena sanguinolenta TaxID=230812 RepID=A0A8H7CEI1_9AGAR|nr:Histidinol-phosphate aminotransferase [Mycena sanguinolenta]
MSIHGLPASVPTVGPSHFDILKVIRPNILELHPYRCARDDYQDGILLDANENSLGHSITRSEKAPDSFLDLDLHRYPDPAQNAIKERIASLRSLPGVDHIFLGVGSDEIIDLLMRVCVAPGKDKILITPPTYGMYSVCAQINDIEAIKCPLELTGAAGEGGESGRFSVRVSEMKETIDANPSIKLIFLCSPGNPTGTLIPLSTVRAILDYPNFKGIVVVDEAYIDFASDDVSAVSLVKEYGNLVVMQTLSKSFGLAGVRLGVALAQPPLIQVLTNTKAPYNISTPTANIALSALSPQSVSTMRNKISTLVASRKTLLADLAALAPLGVGSAIGGNDANFVVVPILSLDGKPDNSRAQRLYRSLAEKNGVVVRYRGNEPGCEGCLRITVGTEEENMTAVTKIREVLSAI